MGPALGKLAVHLPAHPEEQDAAGEHQADDRQQLHRRGGENDAERDGAGDTPEDHLGAHLRRDPRRRHADDDGVVAGEHQVDHDDLGEGDELLVEVHGKRLLSVGWTASRGSPRTLQKSQHGLRIGQEGRPEADEGEGGGHVARR